MNKEYSIKEAANLLNINVQTLRRWDKSKLLTAQRRQFGKIGRFYYYENDLSDFLSNDFKNLLKVAWQWALSAKPVEIFDRFYCPDKGIFKGRSSRFSYDLSQNPKFAELYSLIAAITDEIGNNSFDHNLGNWPDVTGIFFGYNINQKKVILADRGQGFLKTLKQVRPELATYSEALKVAFTEFITGRAPEKRGNGLKYVKKIVLEYKFKLFLQTGDAILNLNKNNSNLQMEKGPDFIKGSFAIISF
jgi:hypothetical protein